MAPTRECAAEPETAAPAQDPHATLCRLVMDRVVARSNGTLQVTLREGGAARKVALLMKKGCFADIDPGHEHGLLTQGVIACCGLSERDLKKATKRAEKSGLSVGEVLFEDHQDQQETILGHLQELFVDTACAILTGPVIDCAFIEHAESQIVEGFNDELSRVLDLLFAGEDVLIEAMRRRQRWDLVEAHFRGLEDIYYATPEGMRYYGEPDVYASEIRILKRLDGVLDLGEVIASVSMDRFEALDCLRAMMRQGEIQPLNPIQLYQLGVDASEKRNFEKARRALQRAIQRGLDDFDIQLKLAQVCESQGRNREAKERYREFAAKCMAQSRPRDAAHAYARILAMDPLDVASQDQALKLLLKEGCQQEAVVLALTAAESLAAAGSPRKALDQLLRVRDQGVDEPQLSKKIIQLAHDVGEERLVEDEIARHPEELENVLDADRTLAILQRQFGEGNDSIEVRVKLVDLHLQKGHRDEALLHVNGILDSKAEKQIQDARILAWLHKTRASLCPTHLVSNRWLIDNQLRSGNREEAAQLLRKLIHNLEAAKEKFQVLPLYRHLIDVLEGRPEPRWELARYLERHGQLREAVKEIEDIGELAAQKGDVEGLEKAWTEVLRLAPANREGLVRFAELLAGSGRRPAACERLQAVFHLDLASGNLAGLRETLQRIESLEGESPELSLKLAGALLAAGENAAAVERLARAAKTCFERNDFGSTRSLAERVLRVEPGNAAATALIAQVRERLEPPQRPAAPAPAPPAPAAAPAPAATAPAAPAPPAPAAASPGSNPIDEAFQPRAPIRKAAVSAITARLRNMKGGASEAAPAPTAPPAAAASEKAGEKAVPEAVKSAAQALKKLQAKPPTAPAPEAAAAPSPAPAAAPPSAPAAPAPAATATAAAPSPGKPRGVGVAASKLKALSGSSAAAPAKAADGTAAPAAAPAAPAGGAGLGATALGSALVNEHIQRVQSAASAGTVAKSRLGGPASKLAKLRGQPSKETVPAE
jgi:tetratricopeptide (TPR) repeat protein